MRAYHGNLSFTAHSGVSITALAPAADELIDRLAKEHDVGRAYVARCVIEHHAEANPDSIAEIVRKKIGEPKRHPRRHKQHRPANIALRVETVKRELFAQDQVCSEINGCVPAGGCRYPYCDCKA